MKQEEGIALKLEVPEDILNKTTECKVNFRCLTDQSVFCEIMNCIDNKVYFTKQRESVFYCSYQKDFGGKPLCTCPVREFIYSKYGI